MAKKRGSNFTDDELEKAKIKYKVDENIQAYHMQKGRNYSLEEIRKRLDPSIIRATRSAG